MPKTKRVEAPAWVMWDREKQAIREVFLLHEHDVIEPRIEDVGYSTLLATVVVEVPDE